jgi:hypothetical protein
VCKELEEMMGQVAMEGVGAGRGSLEIDTRTSVGG